MKPFIRKPHVLSRNHANQHPYRMIFYDTEADLTKINPKKTKHDFTMATACYCRVDSDYNIERERWLFTRSKNELAEFIMGNAMSKTKLYVLAHNQHYDMVVSDLFKILHENDFEINKMIVDSSRVIVEFKQLKRSIVFLDTFNWFKTNVKSLGESLGLPKLKMPSPNASDEIWEEYNKRDVQIIKQYFLNYLQFIKSNDLGNFGFTTASQSLNAYRHKFYNYPIFIHDNTDALNYERMSYFGGRTECFFLGLVPEPKIFDLDINSMYPFVMKVNEYPTQLMGELHVKSVEGVRNRIDKYCVTARVRVRTNEPVFPYRYNEKVIFPVGEFETVLSTPEIRYALDHNMILSVKGGYLYKKNYIFSEFTDYFYNKKYNAKKNNDPISEKFFKLLLNSLYGKFGQRFAEWEEIGLDENIFSGFGEYFDTATNTTQKVRYVCNKILLEGEKHEGHNSFPGIAAHVTAYARIYLWNLMKNAGRHNVYYCDTDSLFVNRSGYDNLKPLLDDFSLGKLKLEKTITHLELRGLKDYMIDTVSKTKGINQKWKQLSENSFEGEYFPKLRSSINKGNLSQFYSYRIKKTLSRKYDKGIVQPSGHILPFVLGKK